MTSLAIATFICWVLSVGLVRSVSAKSGLGSTIINRLASGVLLLVTARWLRIVSIGLALVVLLAVT